MKERGLLPDVPGGGSLFLALGGKERRTALVEMKPSIGLLTSLSCLSATTIDATIPRQDPHQEGCFGQLALVWVWVWWRKGLLKNIRVQLN